MGEEWTEADDVIEEVREIRRTILARFGNDPRRLVEHYIEFDRDYAGPRIQPPEPRPRRTQP